MILYNEVEVFSLSIGTFRLDYEYEIEYECEFEFQTSDVSRVLAPYMLVFR